MLVRECHVCYSLLRIDGFPFSLHLLMMPSFFGLFLSPPLLQDIVKCAHMKHKAQLNRLEDIIVGQEIMSARC